MLLTRLLKTKNALLTVEEHLKSLNKRMMVYHNFSCGCAGRPYHVAFKISCLKEVQLLF